MMSTADGTQVSPQNATRHARLNPFAFPADTDLRFVVLIVSILASSLLISNLLSNFALVDIFKDSSLCILHDKAIRSAKNTTNTHVLDAASYALWKCRVPFLIPHVLFLIGGIVLILSIAVVIYWLIPFWKLIQGRLVPLSTQDAPEIVAYLSSLCKEAKLTPVPRFVWNPLKFTSSPRAFGHIGQYYIALTGGLVTMFSTDQAVFQTTILHELAHLRNRDVNKTYFAIAIWWAFVAVALVPFAIVFLRYPLLATFYQVWRVLPLIVLVYLTLNGVLRAREFYADVRTSTWESSPKVLIRVLQSLRPSHGMWKSLTRFHPEPNKRCQVVYETHRLFQVDLWTTLSLGIALGIAFPNIEELLNDFFSLFVPVSIYNAFWHVGITILELAAFGTALISASLIVGIVGVNIWRTAFAALVQNRPQRGVDRISLCLGGGLILGTLLSLSLENFTTDFSITYFIGAFVQNIPWGLLLLISLMFFLRWIATGAQVWLEIATRRKSPRLIYRTGLVIAGGVLTVWLTQVFLFRANTLLVPMYTIDFAHVDVFNIFLLVLFAQNINSDPGLLLTFITLWAFPLSVWFWRKEATATGHPSWAFLDASMNLYAHEQSSEREETQSLLTKVLYTGTGLMADGRRSQFVQPGSVDARYIMLENVDVLTDPMRSVVPDTGQSSTRLSFALMAGLVGGLVFCCLTVMLQIWRHLSVPKMVQGTEHDQFAWAFYLSNIGLAVLLQAGIAGIVATKVRQLGERCGLFAGFIAGGVMTIGFLGINLLFGGGVDFPFIWLTLSSMVNMGALLAQPTILIMPVMVYRIRRMLSFGSTTPS